ncbi:MAG: hypothetical protein R3325_16335, partial [Thermoanaerobaculia bacterium]|nr:hypothetical protein [Thermoanaerobaculia bacterium]
MSAPGPEELYVGYRARAPRAVTRFLRPRLTLLLVLAVAVAAILAASQRPFEPGRFDFGRPQAFEGTIGGHPYPTLTLDGEDGGPGASLLLVAFGKHGAGEAVRDLDGRRVRLEGTRIETGGVTMLELAAGSV